VSPGLTKIDPSPVYYGRLIVDKTVDKMQATDDNADNADDTQLGGDDVALSNITVMSTRVYG
jgi:hypothetical protein